MFKLIDIRMTGDRSLNFSQCDSSLRYGFVKERLGFVSIVVIAFTVAAVGYLIIGIAGSYNLVLIGLIVVGLGFGLLMPNLVVSQKV